MFGLFSAAVAALALFPLISAHNVTLERRNGWRQETCAIVQGTTGGWHWNFGCLCVDNAGSFCQANNIEQWLQAEVEQYLQQNGNTHWYPDNSQPTCNGKGGYSCGSGQMNSDGTCSQSSCKPTQCPSSGVCCPMGTSWHNGRCCGNTGCENSNSQCQPSCPQGASYTGGKCQCNNANQQLTGPAGQQTCTNICQQSGWTWNPPCSGSPQGMCCPAGSKMQNGKCVCTTSGQQMTGSGNNMQCSNICTQSGWTWNPPATGSPSGMCCPSGSSMQNGQCVCTTPGQQMSGSGSSMHCTNKCQSGWNWCHSQCCKAYQQETNGQCGCPQGYKDTGSACQPICDTAHGYSPRQNNWGQTLCCKAGATPCKTVCCPAGQDEVGNSGYCCAIGSSLGPDGKTCVAPTGKTWHRRQIGNQISLAPKTAVPSYGLESNKNGALCPSGFAACPIPGRPASESDYECIDALTDITSCGGCASLSTGQDCTAIPGARFMGCEMGMCEVYSCRAGWRQVNGTACERI